jgi:NAD(P)-dependent dehydrogenase (short-subunit alcohol dehydrogenase family)
MNALNIFSLKGKTAIITGGAGLIGKMQCKALSDFEASVVVCDIDIEKSEIIANNLNADSFAIQLDVESEKSITKAKNAVLSKTGRIDILINNAAVNDVFANDTSALEQSMFENYPLELWIKSLNVNLTGTFLCCKIFGTEMANQNKGSIINVASTYGMVGPDQSIYVDENGEQKFFKSPSYPAGKGAIINFTRYLAAYWGNKGIRVNTLSPGGIINGQDEYFIKNYSKKTILGKMANPEDYVGAVIFLSSDASSYMTGANLVVDGGWTAW